MMTDQVERLRQELQAAPSKNEVDRIYIENRSWILLLPSIMRDQLIEEVCDARDAVGE